ncbi:hypothetical protein GCM10020221_03210 [Streptomyces thioluteus]|uniref:Glycosyl transferase n=1 Tax=Streptomyces thioluteus TaxID=66431 RepID=A0ABP6IV73_STRTU
MGEKARLRVIEQFTLRQTISAFREIYHDLADTRRPAAAPISVRELPAMAAGGVAG